MKIIDNNGRIFGKVSIIDGLVVLVVIVMAFALHAKNNTLSVTSAGDSGSTITFTALAENLDLQVADAVAVGDKMYDKDHSTGGAIGKITRIERQDATKTEKLKDGTYACLTNADGCNLLITVECTGTVTDGRYSINRVYELGVNANRSFYTPYAAFNAIVTEIH